MKKIKNLFLIILFLFILNTFAFASGGVSADIERLTWPNQGIIPNGIGWLFTVTVKNSETEPIRVDTVVLSYEKSGNFSADQFDTVLIENNIVEPPQMPSATKGLTTIEESPNRITISDLNMSIPGSSHRNFSIFVKMSADAKNHHGFRISINSIVYAESGTDTPLEVSLPNEISRRRTHFITTEFRVSRSVGTPDLVGAQAGPFPVLGFSAAASNGERLSEVTIVLREVNGRFWPGGNASDDYGDLAEVSIYQDMNGTQKFEPGDDKLVKRVGRTSLPRPSLENIYNQNPFVYDSSVMASTLERFDGCTFPWPVGAGTNYSFVTIKLNVNNAPDIPNIYNNNNKSARNDFFIVLTTGKGWGNPDPSIVGDMDANYVGFGDKFAVYFPDSGIVIADYSSLSNEVFANPTGIQSKYISMVTQQWNYLEKVDTGVVGNPVLSADLYSGYPLSDENDNKYLDFYPIRMFQISLLGGTSKTSPMAALTRIEIEIENVDGGFNPMNHIKPITNDQFSGISLWYNEDKRNFNFDYNDQLLNLSPTYSHWEQISPTKWKVFLELEEGFVLPVFEGDTTQLSEEESSGMDEDDEDFEDEYFTYKPPGTRNFTGGKHMWVRFLLDESVSFNQQWKATLPTDGLYFSGGTQSEFAAEAYVNVRNNPPVIFKNQVVNQDVTAKSEPFSVVSLNISATAAEPLYLNALQFLLERPESHPNNFTESDLKILTSDTNSGIALYRDNIGHPNNTVGKFDADIDTFIPLQLDPKGLINVGSKMNQYYGVNEIGVNLSFVNSNDTMITSDGAEFFLVFRTSSSADNEDIFRVAFGDPKEGDGADPRIFLANDHDTMYRVFGEFDIDDRYYVMNGDIWPCVDSYDPINDFHKKVATYGYRKIIKGADRGNRFYSDWVRIHSVIALSFKDETINNQIVDAYSEEIPAIGINVKDGIGGNQKLNAVRVVCSDSSILADLSITRSSGLQLWCDANGNGIFEPDIDQFLTLASPEWSSDTEAVLNLVNAADIPDTDDGKADFFLVIRTGSADFGDTFTIEIPGGGIHYKVGQSDLNYSIKTNIITVGPPVKYEDLTSLNQTFSNQNSPLPVIGININDKASSPKEKFNKLLLYFIDTDAVNFSPQTDIGNLTGDSDAGVVIWRDANGNGTLEVTVDTPIRFNSGGIVWGGPGIIGYPLTIDFTKVYDADSYLIELPDNDIGHNEGNNFFITISPGRQIDYGDNFYLYIPPNGLELSYGPSQNSIKTNVITGTVINNTELTNLVTANKRLKANSEIEPVLRIAVSDGVRATETFDGIVLEFNQGFELPYLAPLSNTDNSGIQLYIDSNNNGVFNADSDTRIELQTPLPTELNNNMLYINFKEGVDISDFADTKSNFFVCVKTSLEIPYGETFTLSIPEYGIRYSSNYALEKITSLPFKFKVPMVIENLLEDHYYVKPDTNTLIPVAGIKVWDENNNGVRIHSVSIDFHRISALITKNSFAQLRADTYSGISLWRAVDTSAELNILDNAVNVPLKSVPVWPQSEQLSTILYPDDNCTVPVETNQYGYDYYIMVRVSDSSTFRGNDPYRLTNDAFSFSMKTDGTRFFEIFDDRTITSDAGLIQSQYHIIADSLKPQIIADSFKMYKDEDFEMELTVNKINESDNFYFSFEYYERVDTPQICLKGIIPAYDYSAEIFSENQKKWFVSYIPPAGTISIDYNKYDTAVAISAIDEVDNAGDTDVFSITVDNQPPEITRVSITGDTTFKNGDTIIIELEFDPVNDTGNIFVMADFSNIDSYYAQENVVIKYISNKKATISYMISFQNDLHNYDPVNNPDTFLVSASDGANVSDTIVKIVIDNLPPTIPAANIRIETEKNISLLETEFVLNHNIINKNKNIQIWYLPEDYKYDAADIYIDFAAIGGNKINYSLGETVYYNTSNLTDITEGEKILPIYLKDSVGNTEVYNVKMYYDMTVPEINILDNDETVYGQLPFTLYGSAVDNHADDTDGYSSGIDAVYITLKVDTGNGYRIIIDSATALSATNTAGSANPYSAFKYVLSEGYGIGKYLITSTAVDKAGNMASDNIELLIGNFAEVKIVSPINNYHVSQGEFRLDFSVDVTNTVEEQSAIILYRDGIEAARTSRNWRGLSHTFYFVDLDLTTDNKQNIFEAVAIDEFDNKSDTSTPVKIRMQDVVAVAIEGKDDKQASFNPNLGQKLKINLPADCSYAKMEIFTLSGEKIIEVNWNSGQEYLEWAGNNEAADLVKNGIYLVRLRVVSVEQNINKTFPIAVIK